MASIQVMILGASGNSQDILDTLNDIKPVYGKMIYRCIGFLDDNETIWGQEMSGIKVHGPLADAYKYTDCFFINGIGNPSNFFQKQKIISRTQLRLERFTTIIHPSASVSRTATLGRGVVVFQNATITTHVSIGNQVVILPNTVISHDTVIGHYTSIAGGVYISGNVTVGDSCHLGANSTLMDAVVLNSFDTINVVVGNPAKFLRKTKDI